MKLIWTIGFVIFLGLGVSDAWAENFKVKRSLTIASPPEEAWYVIGDFCDIDDWHPAVRTCQLKVVDGTLQRILTLADGAQFVEQRIAEEPGLSYTYKIISSPLPIDRYTATLSITRGDSSTITWSGRFSSDDPSMESVIGEIYEAGLSAIRKHLDQ